MENEALQAENARLAAQLEKSQTDNLALSARLRLLEQDLEKKDLLLQRAQAQQSQLAREGGEWQEQLRRLREKARGDREGYDKLLARADKLITFLHGGAVTLSKTLGRMLHHLLLRMPFDMKEVTAKLVVEDVGRLHEWVLGFEKSELVRRAKLFRNIGEKVHFYKQLEIPLLQEAYDKLFEFVRQCEGLAEAEEFSQLNATAGQSRLTCSRVMATSRVSEADPLCLLEDLADRAAPARQGLPDLLAALTDALATQQLGDLPLPLLEDCARKFAAAGGVLFARVLSIAVDPLRAEEEEDALREPLPAEQLVALNHAFHAQALEELQTQLRYLETRFSLIRNALEARGIAADELQTQRLRDLLRRNHALSEEDFSLGQEAREAVELMRLLEDSLARKGGLLRAKRQFIEHLQRIKADCLQRLQRLFEGLNAAEDEYSVAERAINNLQAALALNQQELRLLGEKGAYAKAQREQLERECAQHAEQGDRSAQAAARLQKELDRARQAAAEKRLGLDAGMEQYSAAQKELVRARLELVEVSEQLLFLDELQQKTRAEAGGLRRQAEGQRAQLAQQLAGLQGAGALQV